MNDENVSTLVKRDLNGEKYQKIKEVGIAVTILITLFEDFPVLVL